MAAGGNGIDARVGVGQGRLMPYFVKVLNSWGLVRVRPRWRRVLGMSVWRTSRLWEDLELVLTCVEQERETRFV